MGRLILESGLILGVVCLLAVVTLRLAAKYAGRLGAPADGRRRLEVLERLAVGHREAVVAVSVADRVVVFASSAHGFTRVMELSLSHWQRVGFSEVLARASATSPPDGPPEDEAAEGEREHGDPNQGERPPGARSRDLGSSGSGGNDEAEILA